MGAMSLMGQTEKNSIRAYGFRFALKLGHCSTRSACLKGANNRHLRLEEVELGCILNYFHTAVPLCATVLKKSLTAVHL
jgi:hypothetical protein